jgi:hypothetical protein
MARVRTKQWLIVAKPHIFGYKCDGLPDSGRSDTIGNQMSATTMQVGESERPVCVKRYAGLRLYRPATGAYLTREDLMTMANNDEEFVVIDADTHQDVTPSYRPIIIEH